MAWESFLDESYYGQWAVREVGEQRWGHCFHLPSREEADGLRDVLNQMREEDAMLLAEADAHGEIVRQLRAKIERLRAARYSWL